MTAARMPTGQTESHRPVLLDEALSRLAIKPGGVFVDATFGRGGHSREILRRLGPSGKLIALDKDPEAIASQEAEALRCDPRFTLVKADFRELSRVLDQLGTKQIDAILLDLGVSSPQLDRAERGFSFLKEGPLDLRMDPKEGPSAAELIARIDEKTLAEILRRYGEERHAKRIAKAIVQARQQKPIWTTTRLAEIVAGAMPNRGHRSRRQSHREPGKHPATRTFQALRIYLNRELEALEEVLPQALERLKPGGRLVVISFHSLEDRIVKDFIRRHAKPPPVPRHLPPPPFKPKLRDLGKVKPTREEIAQNPRARSAIMRVAERL